MMGYRTPNIDRLAREGAIFTNHYAQQSCTAGRAAFITGQSCFRTGLLKVGLPGAKEGLSDKDPTLAELLKPQGYATGQFGKNHLGDRNEFLPTVHGFDEFFGNLYHLNAEEEPENEDYPKNAEFRAKFGPRGVLKCKASDKDDPTEDPRFGRVGKQTIQDTGPLNRKRMETVDEEFLAAAMDFMERQNSAGKPFFVWFNSTRMHIYTHLKPASKGKTGLGLVADGMTELDGMVGQLLKKVDDLGIADNTIVVWTTDNGAEVFSWPDGGTTPFQGEKNTNWEGGYRVPLLMRWPGVIKPGTEINEVTSHEDFVPTLVAAAGEPNVTAKLLTGYAAARGVAVSLPGVRLGRLDLDLIPLEPLSRSKGVSIALVLGYELFSRFAVELDYEHGRLRLYDPASYLPSAGATSFPIDIVYNHPYVQASVRSQDDAIVQGRFVIDLGSAQSVILTPRVVQQHRLVESTTTRKGSGGGVGGTFAVHIGRLPSLTVGPFTVRDVVAVLPLGGVLADAEDAVGNLGGGFLRRFRVVFDYSRRRMLLTPNRRFAESDEVDMSGLSLLAGGDGLHDVSIERVRENSPGREAGLRAGDRIVAVDGTSPGELALLRWRELFARVGEYRLTVLRGEERLAVVLRTRRQI